MPASQAGYAGSIPASRSRIQRMIKLIIAITVLITLTGCATVSYNKMDTPSVPGVYHEVTRGETLWGIANVYNIKLADLVKTNRLPDASKIEVGQLIFIPEANEKPKAAGFAKGKGFIWPVRGSVVSYFGSTKDMVKNKGIDIAAHEGTAIIASRGGKVTFASDNLKGYGKTIIIDHLDGFETVYAYNSQNLVTVNEEVGQGVLIAKTGKTGRAEKAMLHFEIRKKSEPQNPFYYLP